ncbi:MAG: prolipoprotein diacylglyceryl transferase [Patescibacteria group bacterium]|jgi:phosphatidylglycerol:prolipoprotein diacylglycerol transferase
MFSTAPNSILLQLGSLAIHWYGLLVVVGFVVGFLIMLFLFKKNNLSSDDAYDLFFYVIVFGIIGARLYYVFYAWQYYSQNLLDVFKIWHGGLAIHGAIIAAIITIYFYSKRKKWSPWMIADVIATCVPLSLAIGRWGNYFNQELFGKPTTLPWSIPIEPANRPEQYSNFTKFHPTFLYESILDLILFTVLFIWQKRRRREAGSEGQDGIITLFFLIGYSVIRFFMEFLRTDYSPLIFGFRFAQVLSGVVFFVTLSIVLFFKFRRKWF